MPATAAPPAERRVAARRRPTLGTVCHLEVGRRHEPELGLVWNISASGISMLLCDPPRPGATMTGTLLTMDGESARAITMHVVHVKKLETGDYLIGGHFDRSMLPDELRPFVA